jgi:ferric-dicitrate binding protein FerR (iron transport regulator)
MAHRILPDSDHDDVGALMQIGGRRETPAADISARVRGAVEDAWEQAVAARWRRRALVVSGAGLAAAATIVLILQRDGNRYRLADMNHPPAIGVVERISGQATFEQTSRTSGGESISAGRAILAGSILRTSGSGHVAMRFESGVSVRVDSSTSVGVLPGNVFVLEHGAIYVSTAGSPGVQVRTPLGDIRDIGTRFEVRLAEASLRVRVRDGRIRLEHRGAAYEAPGGVELAATTATLERRVIPLHGPEWDWTLRASPPFVLEGQTLGSFLDWVEREGGWPVRFPDRQLQQSSSSIVLHGSIDGLTPAEALADVLPTCGLTHRIAGDAVVIEKR